MIAQPYRNADAQTQRDFLQATLDLANRQLNTMTRSPQWRRLTPAQRIHRFNALVGRARPRKSTATSAPR